MCLLFYTPLSRYPSGNITYEVKEFSGELEIASFLVATINYRRNLF